MPKIYYLTFLDFPRRVANRGQIMDMATGFHQSADKFSLVIWKPNITIPDLRTFYDLPASMNLMALGGSKFFAKIKLVVFLASKKIFDPTCIFFVREEKVAWLLKRMRLKYVYEIHEFSEYELEAQLALVNSSFKTIAINESLYSGLISKNINSERVAMINNARPSSFEWQNYIHPSPNADVTVLYAGRFSKEKGIYTLVESFTHLPTNFKLKLIGGFEGEPQSLWAYAAKLGLEGRIEIFEFLPKSEIFSEIVKADILVIPNSKRFFRETNPLKLYEYVAAGKPIICSRLPIFEKLVSEDNVNFFEPDDHKDLARVIEAIPRDLKRQKAKNKTNFQQFFDATCAKRAKLITSVIIKTG